MSVKENFNVLIINYDNSKSNQLYNYLKFHGYHIITCPSINQAMDILDSIHIDTIILESICPSMEGYSKLPRLEQAILDQDIKLLKMTSEKKAG